MTVSDAAAAALETPPCKEPRLHPPQREIKEEHGSADEEEARLLDLKPDCKQAFETIKAFFKTKLFGREPHHGYEHALRVLAWTQTIAGEKFNKEMLTVALCHDVLDHKFTDATEADFSQLLDQILGTDSECKVTKECIMKVIDAISFSKEKKKGMRWYEAHLDDDATWVELRNIVSDADKLEALGVVGAARCYATGRMFAERDGAPTDAPSLLLHVVEHCHDKLFHLGPQYIRTEEGKRFAVQETAVLKRVLIEHGVRPSDLEAK